MERPHKQIGQRIREARVACAQTQRSLAEAAGVTVQSVSQWESGRSQPGTDRLLKIAEFLDVTWSWLKRGEGPREKIHIRPRESRDDLTRRYAPIIFPADDQSQFFEARKFPDQINDSTIIARYSAVGALFSVEITDEIPNQIFEKGDLLIFDTGPIPRAGDIVYFDQGRRPQTLAHVRSVSIGDDSTLTATLRILGDSRDISRSINGTDRATCIVMVEHRRFRRR